MPVSLGGAAVLGGALSMLVYVAMAGAGEPVMQCCGAVVGPRR
jgi:biotin transporter BioY